MGFATYIIKHGQRGSLLLAFHRDRCSNITLGVFGHGVFGVCGGEARELHNGKGRSVGGYDVDHWPVIITRLLL